DVLALCPLVANGGPQRVILVGRAVVDELGAIRPLWRTLPAATTGGGRCPLLIPGLPLAGIVERLALGARDPSAVIGEDLDFPPVVRADDTGVVVLLLRAGADRELALTDGPAVSGRHLAGRAVSALDLDHAPGVVHHNGVAFFGYAVLPDRPASGFLRVGHVRGAAGTRGRGDDARLLQTPRDAPQDILGAKVAQCFARAPGDMDAGAHGFEATTHDPLGAGHDAGISLCAHADDLATTGDPLPACADATRNRQRVREGQHVQGFDRAGFLVEPVGEDTIGSGDHHGAVTVDVVAVLVDVNVGVLVLGRPVHIRLAEDRLCRALRHIVVEAGLVHVFEEAA